MGGLLPQLVVLFVTDQFRHDAFQPSVTPNLYWLSSLSNTTIFTNAYVSTPTCTPARAAILTGKSPWAHGLLGYAASVNCKDYPTTLPSMLAEIAGYETFTVGKNHFGWSKNGDYISHGFQHWRTYEGLSVPPNEDDYTKFFHSVYPNISNPLDITCNGLGYNDWKSCPYGSPNELQHPTRWTTRQALHAIQRFDFRDEHKRMFLKVSYHRPHSPYDPPRRLLDRYLANKVKIPRRFINNTSWDRTFLNKTTMTHDDFHGDPGESAAIHTRAGYLASVEFVDEGVGQILSWLERKGMLDSSLIIWTSDHGDMNGDHNLWRKGYPYEASTHINMVVKLPFEKREAEEEFRGPRTSPAIRESRDVAVTLYDFLGILNTVRERDPLINGRSLVPVLTGQASKIRNWLDLEHSTVYREDVHWSAVVGFYCENASLGDKEDQLLWKFIFHAHDGKEQLFCLTTDPDETYDFSGTKTGVAAYFRGIMIAQFESEQRGPRWIQNKTLVVRKHP